MSRNIDFSNTTNDRNIEYRSLDSELVDMEEALDYAGCAGLISGFGITDNTDGTVAIAAGVCYLRIADSDTAEILKFHIGETDPVTLTDNSENYIYVDFNSGSPIVTSQVGGASIRDNENSEFELYEVIRDGTTLHITDHYQFATNTTSLIQRRLYALPDPRESGLIIGETGTRNVTVTEGKFWIKLNRITVTAINTATGDDFIRYFNNGTWQEQTAQTAWNELQYNNYGTGLATMTNNRWSFQEFYMDVESDLFSVYADAEYLTELAASSAPKLSNIPALLGASHMIYIGRLVFEKSDATSTPLSSFKVDLAYSATTDHSLLANLGVDDHTQYPLLLGRATGQTLIGGTASGDDLTLETTSNVTKGSYIFTDATTSTRLASFGATNALDSTDLVSWVTGTANQLTVTDDTDGTITLSTPQDINTTSSPTFVDVDMTSCSVSGLTATRLMASDGTQEVISTDLNSWVTGTANQLTVTDDTDGTITLSTPQDINTTSSPTFVDVDMTSCSVSGLTATRLMASDGTQEVISTDLNSWVTGTANQLTVTDDTDGTITLSVPQDIHTGASPTFLSPDFAGTLTVDQINESTGSAGVGIELIDILDDDISGVDNLVFLNEDDLSKIQLKPASYLIGVDGTSQNLIIDVPTGENIEFQINSGKIAAITSSGLEVTDIISGSGTNLDFDLAAGNMFRMARPSATAQLKSMTANFIIGSNGGGELQFGTDVSISSKMNTNTGVWSIDQITNYTANGDITLDIIDSGADSSLLLINSDGTYDAKFQINGTTAIDGIIDDDSMATASATTVATSESIVAYVDAAVLVENLWNRTGTNIHPNTASDTLKISSFEPEGAAEEYTFKGNTGTGDSIMNLNATGAADYARLNFQVGAVDKIHFYFEASSNEFVMYSDIATASVWTYDGDIEQFVVNAELVAATMIATTVKASGATITIGDSDNVEISNVLKVDTIEEKTGSAGIDLSHDVTMANQCSIGNTTAPRYGILRISGNATNVAPNTEWYDNSDATYPNLTILPAAHDNITFGFDAYLDGANWESSDAGSNFRFLKRSDVLKIDYDSGIAQGATITWNLGFSVGAAGEIVAPSVWTTDLGAQRPLVVDNTGLIGYNSSLREHKTQIQSIGDVSWAYSIPVRSYYRKQKVDGVRTEDPVDEISFGFVAEEIEEINSDMCFYDNYDQHFNDEGEISLERLETKRLAGVKTDSILAVCLKLIQQQNLQIIALTARVTALEGYH